MITGPLILLLTETETSTENKLLVQLVIQKWLYKISINATKETGDRVITVLSRVYFKNLKNLLKKPINIKRKLLNKRTETFLWQIKKDIETVLLF